MTKIQSLLKSSLHHILSDRPYLLLMGVIALAGLIYVLGVLFTVHPVDTQLVDRYSGLGDTRFYKGKWYTLYQFALFGALMTTAHLVIMTKLHEMEHREAGVVFGWIALTLTVIAASYTFGVMHLAFL